MRKGTLILGSCVDEMSMVHLQCAFIHFDETIHYSSLLVVDEPTETDNSLPVSSQFRLILFVLCWQFVQPYGKFIFLDFCWMRSPKKEGAATEKSATYPCYHGWTIQGLSLQW